MKRLWIILLLIIALGCEDPISVDIPLTASRLVVEGVLTNQLETQVVKISTTGGFNSPERTPRVSAVTVSIINSSGTVLPFLEAGNSGIYHSEVVFAGSEDTAYKLQVLIGPNTYESDFQLIRATPPIDFLSFEQDKPLRKERFLVSVNTRDPAGEGDFYRWRVFRNGSELGNLADMFLRSDRLFNGNRFDVKFETFAFQRGDTCSVVQMSLSEDAFEFFRLLQIQTGGLGESTSPPASQVPGNIRNINHPEEEVLGFFYATAIEKAGIAIR